MSTETAVAVYPIYHVHARFTMDGDYSAEERARYTWWPNDPGEGRIWNSLLHTEMYREDPGLAEVERWAREEWWPKVLERREKDDHPFRKPFPNPSEPEITVELLRHESWCCSWFEHWTFDVGQSDEEALASFEAYVRRYEDMQDFLGDAPENYVCLMGAEDRWRWRGGPGPNDKTDPPCRCEHCKRQGKLRIAH